MHLLALFFDVDINTIFLGRTGRFGRKGVSINFVHDKKSWEDMHMIEEALGRQIVRVDTNDLDVMEEVRIFSWHFAKKWSDIRTLLDIEKGLEIELMLCGEPSFFYSFPSSMISLVFDDPLYYILYHNFFSYELFRVLLICDLGWMMIILLVRVHDVSLMRLWRLNNLKPRVMPLRACLAAVSWMMYVTVFVIMPCWRLPALSCYSPPKSCHCLFRHYT